MDMSDVVEVCESVGVAPQPGPLGVQVGTTGWRIERGGEKRIQVSDGWHGYLDEGHEWRKC